MGAERHRQLQDHPGGFIAAFWHGRLAFSPLWAVPGRRTWAVISANRDGETISRIVGHFGIRLIRGSSRDPRKPDADKGGRVVMVESLKALRAGDGVAIAIDGPRGPRMRAQPGVAALSVAAGAPVVPIAFATRRGRVMNSWDRFIVPMPFDRGVLMFGEAMAPPEGAGEAVVAAHLAAIEARLIEMTQTADRAVGREPTAPAA
ncbi:MAG: lysophospholipid acyltransferase family protein [Rubrimonas sp.]